jgi:hypothetical protein
MTHLQPCDCAACAAARKGERRPVRRLKNLVIRSVALVTAGANPLATVRLAKWAAPPGGPAGEPGDYLRPQERAAIAKSRQSTEALRSELAQLREDYGMREGDDLQSIRKAFRSGGRITKAQVQGAVEELAEELWRRDPTLSREAALSKAFDTPIHPFREVGPDNPVWSAVWRATEAAAAAASPVVKAAQADEQAAWAEPYLTPRIAQVPLLQFDQGIMPEPFRFVLRHGHVLTMQGRRKARPATQGDARTPKQRTALTKARAVRDAGLAKAKLVPRSRTATSTAGTIERSGGKAPPTTAFAHRRAFGLRALGRPTLPDSDEADEKKVASPE